MPITLSVATSLERAISQLSTMETETIGVGATEASTDARILLQYVLNANHAWLITHENDTLSDGDYSAFQTLLKRRLAGEPIAYILGYREFYGLNLKVTPDTLIPRPDTETLVEAALAKTPQGQPTKVLDLGTGTGAIALAIAKYRPDAQITATDASEGTLNIAKENARNLKIVNVQFVLGDWFTALDQQKFDVIVCNPPYIEQEDTHLSQGDLRFEPISALASGVDGLDDIRQVIHGAPQHLNIGGWLMLEHGYNQAKAVAALLLSTGFTEIETHKDLGGNDRVTLSCRT